VFGLVVLALLAYVVRKTYAEIRQPVDAQARLKSRPVAPKADRPPREAHERAQQLEVKVRQMQTVWREEMDEIETRLDTLIRGLSETRSQFEILPPRDTSNESRIKALGVDFQRMSAVEHDR
jgi:hypothetical protein